MNKELVCKNCGHNISLVRDKWMHSHKNRDVFNNMCNMRGPHFCGCSKPEPTERKCSNPSRYCEGCNFILMEDEHFQDADGNEYCEKCKNKIEIIGEDFDYE